MKYALNLSQEGRILSACVVLEDGNYEGMPVVETLPQADISDYLYEDGAYVFDPLPAQEQEETTAPSQEERIAALEKENRQMKEALELLLSGEVEEVSADG